MKSLVVICVLLLGSCTLLKDTGKAVCDAEDKISDGISQVGGFFGPIGDVVAGGLNIILDSGCRLFDVVVSTPHSVGADLGLVSDGEEPGGDHSGVSKDDPVSGADRGEAGKRP